MHPNEFHETSWHHALMEIAGGSRDPEDARDIVAQAAELVRAIGQWPNAEYYLEEFHARLGNKEIILLTGGDVLMLAEIGHWVDSRTSLGEN